MPYTITLTDGAVLTIIPDGQYDNTTSLTLPGKNLSGYGQIQNENFVYLLENFANVTAPPRQLTGQLWFDESAGVLRVYNNNWQPLAVLTTVSNSASNLGNLWYNTQDNQLLINTGTGFSVVGPEGVAGWGSTRFISTILQDSSGFSHPVVEWSVNGEILAIVSQNGFNLGSINPVPGFPSVVRGVTFQNGTTTNVTLYGQSLTAAGANTLMNSAQTGYISSTIAGTPNSIVQTDQYGYITSEGVNSPIISSTSTTGELIGYWSINKDFTPNSNLGSSLGTGALQWNNLYSQNVFTSNIVTGIARFSQLTDPNNTVINLFDTDVTLSADSNNRIATQQAVKTYVDNQIGYVETLKGYTGSSGNSGYTGSSGAGYTGSAGPVGSITPSNPNSAGYTLLPNGLLMQWGVLPYQSDSNYHSASFPTAFNTRCFGVWLTPYQPFQSAAILGATTSVCAVQGVTTLGFNYIMADNWNTGSPSNDGPNLYWFAIGV